MIQVKGFVFVRHTLQSIFPVSNCKGHSVTSFFMYINDCLEYAERIIQKSFKNNAKSSRNFELFKNIYIKLQ